MDNARIQDHYIHDRDAHGTVNGPVWHPTPPNTLGVGSGRTTLWWIRGRTALWWILGGPTAFTPATEVETWRRPAGTGPTGFGGSGSVRALPAVMNAAVPHRGAWRRVLVIRLFMRNPEAMRTFFARPAGGGIAFRTAGCPAVTTCARLTPPPPWPCFVTGGVQTGWTDDGDTSSLVCRCSGGRVRCSESTDGCSGGTHPCCRRVVCMMLLAW